MRNRKLGACDWEESMQGPQQDHIRNRCRSLLDPFIRDTFDMTTTCIGSTAGPGAEPGIRGGEAGNDMLVAST